ncbi:MAG: hypothetical protein MPL62_14900 [Alphaproteobacteria bacterium]|nr:hypothetical protein [Alphaproteobacteria bacterium]
MDKVWDWKWMSNPVRADGGGMGLDPGRASIDISRPGVYVIYEDNVSAKTAVYVGKSDESVFDRMNSHCSEKEKDENYGLYKFIHDRMQANYYVLLGGDAEDRSDYERTLYEVYGGKEVLFNREQPEGSYIDMVRPF